MQDLLFYLFSFLALVCGLLVVVNPFSRNPVTSAMFLVLTIVSLAGLFVLLHAFFLAAVQILVYAGAVMVLFLFVVMMLDLKEEEQRTLKKVSLICGGVSVAGLAGVMITVMRRNAGSLGVSQPSVEGTTRALGEMLFQKYLLPFEILSVLLLVAMVGVILLSKKDLK
jgi:NADH-quinone oxidoreductase subunit J